MIHDLAAGDFRHEARLYRGESQFVQRVAPFILDGVAAGEPTLVMVSGRKVEALRAHIGSDADGLVEYRDMEVVGANPARIIPAWDAFAVTAADQGAFRLRGVGEPIWPGRAPAQMAECHWHEALINRAFAHTRGFWLICPYDAASLDPSVVLEARRTHPVVLDEGASGSGQPEAASESYVLPTTPLASALPDPEGPVIEMRFDGGALGELRTLVAVEGARAGMLPSRLDDLILAVSEVATNSVTHGGGSGTARIWRDGDDVVCEVSDNGVITDPLVDRHRPGAARSNARGLWTANQLCDLVQIRSSADTGVIVRLRIDVGHRAA